MSSALHVRREEFDPVEPVERSLDGDERLDGGARDDDAGVQVTGAAHHAVRRRVAPAAAPARGLAAGRSLGRDALDVAEHTLRHTRSTGL